MKILNHFLIVLSLFIVLLFNPSSAGSQDMPTRYAMLELFTNTPCPICGSQNPGLFNRLAGYNGEYHLISFYDGKPYASCIFYQANIPENTARYQFYTGEIFGSPTVALNGIDFKSSSGVTNTVLDNITGATSWLHVDVEETPGANRTVEISLEDVVGGSLAAGRLFAVIVEKEIQYNAPNGETLHHNVFRRFLTSTSGESVDLSGGSASRTFTYDVDSDWDAAQTYVIAWVSDPTTKEIYNSGTRFDPDFVSSVVPASSVKPLAIYPNPATTEVYVTLPETITPSVLYMYDHQGRVIQNVATNGSSQLKINTSQLASGIYFVNFKVEGELYTGKFEIVK